MNPVTHFLTGWAAANADSHLDRRERAAITLAGVSPDIDGAGIIAEYLSRKSGDSLVLWWTDYHHTLLHNITFAIFVSVACALVAKRRLKTAALAFLSFNLHILGDIIGSKGPDGDHWPIPYLMPFSRTFELSWSGQWQLNSWQNIVITVALLLIALSVALKRGHSPVEIFSLRADTAVVKALRGGFAKGKH